jgi:hypothetical protein
MECKFWKKEKKKRSFRSLSVLTCDYFEGLLKIRYCCEHLFYRHTVRTLAQRRALWGLHYSPLSHHTEIREWNFKRRHPFPISEFVIITVSDITVQTSLIFQAPSLPSLSHERRFHNHVNTEVLQLLDNAQLNRRLKRIKPFELCSA